jgi:hypothetical protein
MEAKLHRYWFVGDGGDRFGVTGIGVTAFTEDDARAIVRQAILGSPGRQLAARPLWSVESVDKGEVIVDVDIRLLDQGHVIPNMGLVVDRGVWWPRL